VQKLKPHAQVSTIQAMAAAAPRAAHAHVDTSDSRKPVSLVLADDHAVVRSGLRVLLERRGNLRVVGEAGDVPATLEFVRERCPDVVVLDLHMGATTSLTAVPEIVACSPRTRVVILTMQTDAAFVRETLRAGAVGYVVKEAADTELLSAIEAAVTGGHYVSPRLGAQLADPDAESGQLSSREIEVLRLIALGYTNKEIGEMLFLSVRTVESHRGRIQAKLGVSTRHDLVEYALRHGLVREAIDGGSAAGNGH